VLRRPRLLALAARRWDHRVLTVVAPAGFGKTTLLAQATEENALEPRGTDVWLTCEPTDAAGTPFGSGVLRALGAPSSATTVSAEMIADALWHRAPEQIALILDDVQELGTGTPGALLLERLVAALPANAHLVLASRAEPPVALRRLESQDQVVHIGEPDLRLDAGELDSLAGAEPGIGAHLLQATNGWPALAGLALAGASRGSSAPLSRDAIRGFAWEEVIAHLGDDRRRALAAVVTAGAGDDELASAAADRPVQLRQLLAGLPLVDWRGDGSCRVHDLWEAVLAGELDDTEATAVRRRAATVHHARGELVQAVELLARAGDQPAVQSLLVEATLSRELAVTDDVLARWERFLPASPPTPIADLLAGVRHSRRDPGSDQGRCLVERATGGFRHRNDRIGELAGLAHLLSMAWHRQDVAELEVLREHIAAVHDAGCGPAAPFVLLARALLASASRDYERGLAAIDALPRGSVSPAWAATLHSLRSTMLLMLGRAEEALAVAGGVPLGAPARRTAVTTNLLVARWFAACPLEVVAALPIAVDDADNAYDRYVAAALAAIAWTWTGNTSDAAPAIDELAVNVGTLSGAMPRGVAAGTRAGLAVANGDDEGAAGLLRDFLVDHPLEVGPVEQALRRFLTLPYVLVPESRGFWDEQRYGAVWEEQRAAARALVDARAGRLDQAPDVTPERLITALPLPWAVELAVALDAGGHRLGRTTLLWLLEQVGEPARQAVRRVAGGRGSGADSARLVLAAVPVPPRTDVRIEVLGPSRLWRGAELVEDGTWRRRMVRLLLCHLIAGRDSARPAIAAALWPDLDEQRASQNLRVNLNHLHSLLEPARAAGDATWFVQARDGGLQLRVCDELRVDLWEFEALLDEADAADRAGVPSATLDASRRALALWRGEPLDDARFEDWAREARDRVRGRFVRAGVRAGELALAAGEPDEAEGRAHGVLAAEPWSEGAYRVLVEAHLARGDRGSALRAAERCREMLADLGVTADALTGALLRRVAAGP